MSKFKKKESGDSGNISTASLPDIVFMLLFFFMVATKMRETTIKVEQDLPEASQIQKLEDKSLVTYVYIGAPKEPQIFGTESKVQVNDVFVRPEELVQWVEQEKSKMPEVDRDKMVVSMKVDEEVKLGIITDVKLNLRKANARKVNYSSTKRNTL